MNTLQELIARKPIRILTSNPGKFAEYRRFLGPEVTWVRRSLPEPVADPLTIARYKASLAREMIVEDVSLDVEGAEIGVQVKAHLATLGTWVGHRAVYRCLIGVRMDNLVTVFSGEVNGRLVEPRGSGFGFDPFFLPEGIAKTLGERDSEEGNARWHAIQALKENRPYWVGEPLERWDGPFQ